MNDEQIKKILDKTDTPAADKNARKRAINLAMAEFKDTKKKNKKISQGIPFLSRLMSKTNTQTRRDPMEKARNKRFVYGGMATAMAVVLIAGVSFNQLQDFGTHSDDDVFHQYRQTLEKLHYPQPQLSTDEKDELNAKIKKLEKNKRIQNWQNSERIEKSEAKSRSSE